MQFRELGNIKQRDTSHSPERHVLHFCQKSGLKMIDYGDIISHKQIANILYFIEIAENYS
jgi:hypothetical protein